MSARAGRIDHLGIAVTSLESTLPFWSEALGLEVSHIETVDSEGVKVAFLQVGESRIELLEPVGEDSTVGRYLAKRGGGIHHLTFAVPDIDAMVERLYARDVEILGGGVRPGAEGTRVAFLHPKAAGGVLVELVEREGDAPAAPRPRARRGTIGAGDAVLLYLREPSQKMWGVLDRLDPSGAVIDGIDLDSFDDWIAQIERGEDSVVGPNVVFVPMSRVEKILLDRSSGHLPSLAERFERRVGRTVQTVLAELSSGGA